MYKVQMDASIQIRKTNLNIPNKHRLLLLIHNVNKQIVREVEHTALGKYRLSEYFKLKIM